MAGQLRHDEHMHEHASVRIDRWLWSVRLLKTRTAATAACGGGHVKVNGTTAKPSTLVRPGDEVVAQLGERRVVLEVISCIDKRVGAPIAAACYLDRTPAPPPGVANVPVFVRDASAGRPTKKDRRQLDRLRRR
jgi:ribosome-associated heat shock protein Hsp15